MDPAANPSTRDLIHDWNTDLATKPTQALEVNDETLRDGLQSPSVTSPRLEDKFAILRLMAELAVDGVNIGLPGASPQVAAETEALARVIVDENLALAPNCAARTVIRDIEPVIEIAQRTGLAIEVATFLGSSPIRRYTENWRTDQLVKLTADAVNFVVGEGLPSMYVTEDTVRTDPETVRTLYRTAIDCGASRLVVCDTVGHATPAGTRNLIRFVRSVVAESGASVKVDWHGHNDRGFGLINAIAAFEAGADRVHATALGIGERCGNTAMDQLLVNLRLLGWREGNLERLTAYCHLVSQACEVPIPKDTPIVGADAFETGTGVHAAAVVKAYRKGDAWLANRVYSGVPADWIGREQSIVCGPMSGRSNVLWALERLGLPVDDNTATRVFDAVKRARRNLTNDEVRALAANADLDDLPHFETT